MHPKIGIMQIYSRMNLGCVVVVLPTFKFTSFGGEMEIGALGSGVIDRKETRSCCT